MSTILPLWCSLSANLGYRSKACCTQLAENTGREKSPKIRHLRTIAQLCWLYLRNKGTYRQLELVKQQYLPHTSSQYGELQPTSG